jgi:hypothetical protein
MVGITMTNSPKIPLPRLQAYLSKVILWHGETDTTISLLVRQAVKWLFDLLRNAVIAGVVKYLATKSDSWLLKIVSDVAFLRCWRTACRMFKRGSSGYFIRGSRRNGRGCST